MNITTRYSLGDVVWSLRTWHERLSSVCPLCDGTAKVTIADTDRTTYCPDCSGNRGRVYDTEPTLSGEIRRLTIGQVRCQFSADTADRTYMCEETGIGSGRVYSESDLYPDLEAAKQTCEAAGAVLKHEPRRGVDTHEWLEASR